MKSADLAVVYYEQLLDTVPTFETCHKERENCGQGWGHCGSREKSLKEELNLLLLTLLFISSRGQALLLERKAHQLLIFQASFC